MAERVIIRGNEDIFIEARHERMGQQNIVLFRARREDQDVIIALTPQEAQNAIMALTGAWHSAYKAGLADSTNVNLPPPILES